jgi:hypothetical protein
MLPVLFIRIREPGCPLCRAAGEPGEGSKAAHRTLGEKISELVTEGSRITSKDIAESYPAAQPQKECISERMKDDRL